MPLTITRLTADEAKKEFSRSGSSEENLGDYIDTINSLAIGEGFKLPVAQAKDAKGKDIDVVVISDNEDEDMPSMRAFKRRMNAAAELSNKQLKWKPRGHRVGEGNEAHFVIDAIAVQVRASTPKVTKPANGRATGK